jgi:ribosome-associated protein
MLKINDNIAIPEAEIGFTAVRSRGPGGQNVNKVSSAVHLRFDAANSAALPDDIRERLLQLKDQRITADGVINIKAQNSRSQEKNRIDALERLRELIQKAAVVPKVRKKTKPGKRAREKRLADKSRRSQVKQSRGRISED